MFDAHGGQSLAARTLALTADGGPVRSRHGLAFLPRADLANAVPRLDRLLVPGIAAAATRARLAGARGAVLGHPGPEYVHDRPGFAFDAALSDLARSTDVATTRWTAKVLELPTDGLVLDGPAWPWAPTVLALPAAAAVAGAARLLGRRRGGRREPLPVRAAVPRTIQRP